MSSETDRIRQEIKDWVRQSMKKGEMDAEPEMTLSKHDRDSAGGVGSGPTYKGRELDEDEDEGEGDVEEDESTAKPKEKKEKERHKDKDKKAKSKDKKVSNSKSKAKSKSGENGNLTLEGDDFFGSD